MSPFRRVLPALTLVVVTASAAGCALGGGTLGGRQKCWPDTDHRAASLWRGILEVDAFGGKLKTPEGDVIPLLSGAVRTTVAGGVGELVSGTTVVAKNGDDVSLFGGAGSDGALVVCSVEEVHPS